MSAQIGDVRVGRLLLASLQTPVAALDAAMASGSAVLLAATASAVLEDASFRVDLSAPRLQVIHDVLQGALRLLEPVAHDHLDSGDGGVRGVVARRVSMAEGNVEVGHQRAQSYLMTATANTLLTGDLLGVDDGDDVADGCRIDLKISEHLNFVADSVSEEDHRARAGSRGDRPCDHAREEVLGFLVSHEARHAEDILLGIARAESAVDVVRLVKQAHVVEIDLLHQRLAMRANGRRIELGGHVLPREGVETEFGQAPWLMLELLTVHRDDDCLLGEFRGVRVVYTKGVLEDSGMVHFAEELADLFHRRSRDLGDGQLIDAGDDTFERGGGRGGASRRGFGGRHPGVDGR
jgi:hypothetical protein